MEYVYLCFGVALLFLFGIARFATALFLTIVYFIPAGFAYVHGHGRNGKIGVYDTLDLDKPFAPLIWAAVMIWLLWPILKTVRSYMGR
jgi:hypothetical protein